MVNSDVLGPPWRSVITVHDPANSAAYAEKATSTAAAAATNLKVDLIGSPYVVIGHTEHSLSGAKPWHGAEVKALGGSGSNRRGRDMTLVAA